MYLRARGLVFLESIVSDMDSLSRLEKNRRIYRPRVYLWAFCQNVQLLRPFIEYWGLGMT